MKAMILGGVAPHIELIKVLKQRGYETILVDYLDDPPARRFADRFFRVSTLDREAVLALAEEEKIDLIISICVDHANVTLCHVAEHLGLPMPYSLETALLATDKGLMKERMKLFHIPTSDFFLLTEGEPLPEKISFPAVIKPVDNNGSKGVRKVSDRAQLERVLPESLSLSRKGEVIIEDFNPGKEIQVDCFANHGRTYVLMIREKLWMPRREGHALQSRGSIVPARLSDGMEAKIEGIARQIAKAFCFEHTPFFFQAIVNGEDIRVLELSPRIGGGLSYKMLRTMTDFPIVEAIVDSYYDRLGEVTLRTKEQSILTRVVYGVDGIFDRVTGLEALTRDGVIESFDLMAEKGKRLGSELDSRNRIGAYMMIGSSPDDLEKKERRAMMALDVLDPDGRSILYRTDHK